MQGDIHLRPAARPPHSPIETRPRWPIWLALGLAAAFAVVTVLVLTGATQALDIRIIRAFRPNQESWGDQQRRFSPWMSRLRPQHMYVLLVGTAVVMSGWRRSLYPLMYAAGLATTSAVVTLLVKFGVRRPDPYGYVTTTGGSYPSGHVVALVVCGAACLFVVFPRVRSWMWMPLAAALGLLAAALVVVAAHWPTDVLGGLLLALALVSASSSLPVRQRAVQPARTSSPRKSKSRGTTTSAS